MNYLQKNQRHTLLKLNNNFSEMTDIKEKILNRSYEESLAIKNLPTDLADSEKHFYYNWTNESEIEEIKFEAIETSFTYLKVTAFCEFSTRRVFDQNTGTLLPKKDRLNTSSIEVIFVKSDKDLYAVVFSSDFYDLRRVKRLIGEHAIDPLTSTHQTDSELFHWLFYKSIKEEVNLNEDIVLDNINGFTGTIVSEEDQFEGSSIQTAELIITKAFITNGYPITSIKIDLQMDLGTISFYLNELSDGKELKIVIQKNSSINNLMSSEEVEYVIPIYVFFYLIPEVIRLYKADEANFLSNSKNKFLSEIGLEVIKTIMAKNDILVTDIK